MIIVLIIIGLTILITSRREVKKSNREVAKKMSNLMFTAYEYHLKYKKEYSDAQKMKNSPEKEAILKNCKNGFYKCLSVLNNEKLLEESKYLSKSDRKALEELLARPRYISVD